jgi:lipopolysaccharide heptosyltransferase II
VNSSPAWRDARRILCIRLDSLGDVLMTMPAVRAIKQALPASSITLLTSPAGAEPAPYLPEIDDVIVYQAPWLKPARQNDPQDYDQEMLARLAAGQFDAVVIFTVYSQSPLPAALFCTLAGIPLRAAHCRENPYHLLSDWIKESEPEQQVRHEVQRQLDLVASLGFEPQDPRMRFCLPPTSRASARQKLRAAGINPQQPWIAIHPGVSAPSRQYRPKGYAQVADQLISKYGLQVVFTGSAVESDLVAYIQAQMKANSASLAGQLSLPELAGVLQQAALLLANNTGPVHLAAAVDTPVVDLYALTNPQHTPWGVPSRVLFHDVPCKFCYKSICPLGHHACLEMVSPAQVVDAVLDLLSETAEQPETRTGLDSNEGSKITPCHSQ